MLRAFFILLLSLALLGPARADETVVVNEPVCGHVDEIRGWLEKAGLEEFWMGTIGTQMLAGMYKNDKAFAIYTAHVNGMSCVHFLGADNWLVEKPIKRKGAHVRLEPNTDEKSFIIHFVVPF